MITLKITRPFVSQLAIVSLYNEFSYFNHRRSQEVHWVRVHPKAEKKCWPNLLGKVVSAPPDRERVLPGRAEVHF